MSLSAAFSELQAKVNAGSQDWEQLSEEVKDQLAIFEHSLFVLTQQYKQADFDFRLFVLTPIWKRLWWRVCWMAARSGLSYRDFVFARLE